MLSSYVVGCMGQTRYPRKYHMAQNRRLTNTTYTWQLCMHQLNKSRNSLARQKSCLISEKPSGRRRNNARQRSTRLDEHDRIGLPPMRARARPKAKRPCSDARTGGADVDVTGYTRGRDSSLPSRPAARGYVVTHVPVAVAVAPTVCATREPRRERKAVARRAFSRP